MLPCDVTKKVSGSILRRHSKRQTNLVKTANLQLQHSETGIAEFIQSVSAAREIRKGYIETIYQYNIASLEYELYQ